MTDFLVSIAGWLGEFLLNFFDFVFFLAFLLCLFICLGHAFGYSILSGKAQRSLGLVFLCVLASIILFPTVVFYYMMDIKQGYSLSQTYSMILDANEVTKATFFSIAISAALPALLIGYWMNPSLDLPDIKKIAEEKASGLLERWKERTLYDQERICSGEAIEILIWSKDSAETCWPKNFIISFIFVKLLYLKLLRSTIRH